MRNIPDSGFDPAKIDTISIDEIVWKIRRMSCEELLTCRVLTSRQSVCSAIQRELFARLEVGDGVEVIRGFERVVKVTPSYILLDGRGRTKYTPRTTGFYHAQKDGDNTRYSCFLRKVEWVMDKEREQDGFEVFEAIAPRLEREVLSGEYNVKAALTDEEEDVDEWEDDWEDDDDE